MKTTYLSLIIAIAAAPVIAWADDNSQSQNSQNPQTSPAAPPSRNEAPKKDETVPIGQAASPQADPTVHPGKAGVPPEVPQTHNVNFDTTIVAVDPAAKTITIDDKNAGPRTIQVFDNTKGATGAEAADWNVLKIGAQVKGVYRRDGDKFVAESLSVVR
jgi:hypothetical protein